MLRCAYVVLVPLLLGVLAQLMPVAGIVVASVVASAVGALASNDRPYKRMIVIAIVLLLVTGLVEYFRKWSPLPFGAFIGTCMTTFALQLIAALAIALPVVTTLRRVSAKLVVALLALCAASIVGGVLVHVNSDAVAFDVRSRIEARLQYDKKKSFQAYTEGLNAAYLSLRDHPGDLDRALDAAQTATEVFYRHDEARALRLWSGDGILMLYARRTGGNYLWLARNDKRLLTEREQLPDAARALVAK